MKPFRRFLSYFPIAFLSLTCYANATETFSNGTTASVASPQARYWATVAAIPSNMVQEATQDHLRVWIDQRFTVENHRRVLASGGRLFVQFALEDDVLDCAFQVDTWNTPPNRVDFARQLHLRLTPGNSLFLIQYADPVNVGAGRELGRAGEVDGMMVGINSTALLRHFGTNFADFGRRANDLAGTIGHEVVHNMGYAHRGDNRDDFVYRYGDCLTEFLNEM